MRRGFLTGLGIICLALILSISFFAWAADGNKTIGYQGKLLNASGEPVSGTVNIVFTIYGTAAGSTVLWTETQNGVTVDNGIFSAQLGKLNPIESSLFKSSERYLGVKVGADAEMVPRVQLSSVAYAMNAQRIGGKRVQIGTATLNVSNAATGTAAITYPEAFAQNPTITLSGLNGKIGTTSFVATEITSQTVNGCVITFRSLPAGANATGSASFSWIAIGE